MSNAQLLPNIVPAGIEKKLTSSGKSADKNYYTLTRKDNNFQERFDRNYKGGEPMKHLDEEITERNQMEEEEVEKPKPLSNQSVRSKYGTSKAINLAEL